MPAPREIFRRLWTKQTATFLFFLGLSTTFWLFTTLNDDYRDELDVGVVLTNVPDNVVITTDPPTSLRVSVRDKGFMVLAYRYRSEKPTITIDFQSVVSRGSHAGYVSLQSSEFLKAIQAQFSPEASVQIVRPSQVEFYFNYGESKRVPLRLLGQFEPKSNTSILTMAHYEPDSVTVYAQPAVLDTITAAYTERRILSNLEDTTRLEVPLQKVAGVKFEPAVATLVLACDRMVEKTLSVPVQGVNFPADKRLRTFPARVNVIFQVGMGLYRSITADDFVLVVNYEDLINAHTPRCKLAFKSLPDGVQRVRISPSEVDYVIEEVSE